MLKTKAFTLVELLVAMAIIGILLGLAIFGISAAQRNSRDTERRTALSDINAGIADYFNITGGFPVSIDLVAAPAGGNATAKFPSGCTVGTVGCVVVPLKAAAAPATPVANLSAAQYSAAATPPQASSANSFYCFKTVSDGYALSVRLESGQSYDAGTSQATPKCSY
jgi:prepilin-type N-terminal cleavage/methylation domain-containing protein